MKKVLPSALACDIITGASRKLHLLLAHAAGWGDRFPTVGPIWLQRKKLNKRLEEAGFEVLNEGLKLLWNPDDEQISQCISFCKGLLSQ